MEPRLHPLHELLLKKIHQCMAWGSRLKLSRNVLSLGKTFSLKYTELLVPNKISSCVLRTILWTCLSTNCQYLVNFQSKEYEHANLIIQKGEGGKGITFTQYSGNSLRWTYFHPAIPMNAGKQSQNLRFLQSWSWHQLVTTSPALPYS